MTNDVLHCTLKIHIEKAGTVKWLEWNNMLQDLHNGEVTSCIIGEFISFINGKLNSCINGDLCITYGMYVNGAIWDPLSCLLIPSCQIPPSDSLYNRANGYAKGI